ncbi:MAG: hypothetical protein WA584_18145 [Pyrinomonadaceae bacterium]
MPEDNPILSPPSDDDVITSPPIEDNPTFSPPVENNPVLSPPFEDTPIISPPAEDNPILSPPIESPPNPPIEPNSPKPKKPHIEDVEVIPDDKLGGKKEIGLDDLSAIQKAGMRLAIGVGSVITLVILVILAQSSILVSSQSKSGSVQALQNNAAEVIKQNANVLSTGTEEQKQNALNTIKLAQEEVNKATLNDSTWTRITELFDLIAVKALLPIFMTILGYIFGSKAARGENT